MKITLYSERRPDDAYSRWPSSRSGGPNNDDSLTRGDLTTPHAQDTMQGGMVYNLQLANTTLAELWGVDTLIKINLCNKRRPDNTHHGQGGSQRACYFQS